MNRNSRLALTAGLLATLATAAVPVASAATLAVALPPAAQSLAGRSIVVDPGHGGRDPGTIANGLREKDLTLPIGLALQAELQARGARVIMTRTSDVALGPNTDADLQARVEVAKQNRASAFVSVHANYADDPNYGGATTYFGADCGFVDGVSMSPTDVGRSYALGKRIQGDLVAQTGETDRGTRSQVFWVLGDVGIPSVLVETGFLSNKGEAAKLANPGYQQQVAHAIADGLADFFASGDATGTPAAPAAALAPCAAPPGPPEVWVQTFLPAPLLSGADPKAVQFSVLPPFSFLKVLGQAGSYLFVLNPKTGGAAYVEAAKVGPSGPPPSFQPFWVQNFKPTGIWSAPSDGVSFGTARQFSFFQVLQPQDGSRLFVRVAATGGVAYVDAKDVGPSGGPS